MEFEKLGAFYLGKEYDLKERKLLNRLLMYDARDLTTHAVCVGMTGSGKTGLCIDLLEEAAIDQVPAIIIDPKGDMTNLLLGFPDLEAKDFRPWVNVDDARRKGLSLEEFAGQQASLWSKGLQQWGQDGSRIRLLKNSADYVIYTPGSGAGIPVSILESFGAPSLDWDTDAELIRERIQGIVAGLLGLIGVDADPVRSRESILLASLFEHYWKMGKDLDMTSLILAIQKPPLSKVGVFDVETFFPEKERFELAMGLNNIIASPAFQSWTEGQPMDIGSFLATDSGKPRHSIFYIAHLSEPERMFFVTMLLNQVLTWIRSQPGTTSLRAILYMDEIFGYFPPVANPPSKKPMLTLLKQARAYGLGVVLATQNPVDLDYKGLTNAGTWFIGRLQTERDKARVLDGLEGLSGQSGKSLDRATISKTISDLDKRVFLLHNVHEEAPMIFQTRWAMNYLRGPMTRSQIKAIQGKPHPTEKKDTEQAIAAPAMAQPESPFASTPPFLPPDVGTVFLPVLRDSERAAQEVQSRSPMATESSEAVIYVPHLVGMARVHFVDRKTQVNEVSQVSLLVEPPATSGGVNWGQGRLLELLPRDLMSRPYAESRFMDVPESINQARELKAIEKDFSDYLYRTQNLVLLHNDALKATSSPSESKRDFLMRLNLLARERRDAEVDSLNRRYEKKLQRLEERVKRAHITLEKKEDVASSRKTEAFFSIGESILGVFLGRRATRAASAGMSKYRMSSTAKMAAREAAQDVESLEKEIQELREELTTEAGLITDQWDESVDDLQEKPITPRRVDIDVELLSVAWVPHWEISYKNSAGLSRSELVTAI